LDTNATEGLDDTIRRLFRDEPGVLKVGSPELRFKRKRWQISIPQSVLERVHHKDEKLAGLDQTGGPIFLLLRAYEHFSAHY
jgi:hypothetical protein